MPRKISPSGTRRAAARPHPRPVVFVDLDGTLISEWSVDVGEHEIEASWGRHWFAVRPSAREFLSGLKSLGVKVVLCTAADAWHAEQALAITGFAPFFSDVVSREHMNGGMEMDDHGEGLAVLVDNDRAISRPKAYHLRDNGRFHSVQVVHVPTYYGKEDQGLQEALAEVSGLIADWRASLDEMDALGRTGLEFQDEG